MSTPPVAFGDVTLAEQTDTAGRLWVCENLTGWADLPATTQQLAARVFDHGGWFGDAWYQPRILTIEGAVAAVDQASLQQALHAIRAQHATSVRNDVTLAVAEVDGTRTLDVRATQTAPQVTYLNDHTARFVLEVVAAWPIKAGDPHTDQAGTTTPGHGRTYPRGGTNPWWQYGAPGTTGDIYPDNAGNAPVHPVWVIQGPVTNPRIIAPDQNRTLTFNITLGAGDILVADAETHTVLLNEVGNRRYVLTPDSAWFDLPPGETLVQFRSTTNTGTLTAHYDDGWW